jgi:hypothetical protein
MDNSASISRDDPFARLKLLQARQEYRARYAEARLRIVYAEARIVELTAKLEAIRGGAEARPEGEGADEAAPGTHSGRSTEPAATSPASGSSGENELKARSDKRARGWRWKWARKSRKR